MLLTITTTHAPAADLGYLLHKHPGRFQSYDLSFGRAHVFYREVSDRRCAACLLLDVDPVGIVRGKGGAEGLLSQYVNDRPYTASSFLSVAISQVYGTALQGRCKDRPELAATPIPLSAHLDVLPVRGGERLLHALFEPLGYALQAERHPLDSHFPEWGESPYYSVTITKTTLASEGAVHSHRDHRWHMATLAQICHADSELFRPTPYLVVDVTDPVSQRAGVEWWEALTGQGGEGMVVKPSEFIHRGSRGLSQPAVKCRGREYLRIIYGPHYDEEENRIRLSSRGLGRKRSLALGEFALGLEALERFVRKEPLRRVHECVFAILALESEPVDPRL